MPSTVHSDTSLGDTVAVVAAVVSDDEGNILVARRPADKHEGDKWEFPGGKIEPGEDSYEALVREIREEIGISILSATRLIRAPYHYPEKTVVLDTWQVKQYKGVPRGCEGQQIAWIAPHELGNLTFPDANRAIIGALVLPHLYAISDIKQFGETRFISLLETALKAGLQLLQLREHHMKKDVYLKLAMRVIDIAHRYNARVLLNGDPAWVLEAGADGVHLTEQRLMALNKRPLAREFIVAASCHNIIALRQAERVEADFVVVSPVKHSASHPQSAPLDWEAFQALCASTSVPVFALGGMTLDDAETARFYGAQGLAMIRGLWQSDRIGERKTYQ